MVDLGDSGYILICQYEMNVRTLLDFTERLYKQEGYEDQQKVKLPLSNFMFNCMLIRKYYVINVSSAVVHVKAIAAAMPAYSLTKASGQFLLQRIAQGVDPKKMQIVNFHPGMIFSETSKNSGLDENSLSWDNGMYSVVIFIFFSHWWKSMKRT